jgi:hypothetical protein
MRDILKFLTVISSGILLVGFLCACGSGDGKSSKSEPPKSVWMKIFGGAGNDSGSAVQQTPDGGYLIVGTTSSFGAGGSDIYLIRTDAHGNATWTKTFGGTEDELGSTVYQLLDGGYLIVGAIAFKSDIYLVRTDSDWETVWTKTVIGTGNKSSFQQSPDGNFIITMTTDSSVDLIKMDAGGNTLWTKTFDVPGVDIVTSLGQTSDDGYIIVGKKTVIFDDVYLIKTDSEGKVLWTNTLGSTGQELNNSVQQVPDGGYLIFGNYSTSPFKGRAGTYLIRTDSEGKTLWKNSFTGTWQALGFSVWHTTDGGYIIAGGTTAEVYFWGDEDVYLVKTDSNGNKQWEKTYGGLMHDWAMSVQQTSDGGYILVGETNSFSTSMDIYLIKTDSEGITG